MKETADEHSERLEAERAEINAHLPLRPDGTLDVSKAAAQGHFDDVLDEAHSTQGDASHVSAKEREDMERQERAFLHALKAETTAALLPQGLKCIDAEYQLENEGYALSFTDHPQQGWRREYAVLVTLDEALEAFADGQFSGRHDGGRRIIDMAIQRALVARATYYERMQ